jgi:hypothetical protein
VHELELHIQRNRADTKLQRRIIAAEPQIRLRVVRVRNQRDALCMYDLQTGK